MNYKTALKIIKKEKPHETADRIVELYEVIQNLTDKIALYESIDISMQKSLSDFIEIKKKIKTLD